MKIEHDDSIADVIGKINRELRKHGVEFEDDGLEHDGWIEFELVELDVDGERDSYPEPV